MKNSEELFNEDKESLIDLIEWYRDDYFGPSMVDLCNSLIQDCRECSTPENLNILWQITDDWLYD